MPGGILIRALLIGLLYFISKVLLVQFAGITKASASTPRQVESTNRDAADARGEMPQESSDTKRLVMISLPFLLVAGILVPLATIEKASTITAEVEVASAMILLAGTDR